jgi:hypothetical protein
MKTHLKNKTLFLVIVLIAFLDGMLVMQHLSENTPVSTANQVRVLQDSLSSKTAPAALTEVIATEPEAKSVPFTTQAPLGYWTTKPWADFAEEACVYMAYKWGTDSEMPGTAETATNLEAIGQWETEHLGSSALTDISQTLQMLNLALGYAKATISVDTSIANLKTLLDGGAILIVPVNGQILDNRYYGDPAPQYHMIVIYDYNAEGFLSNDPGTSRGKGALYTETKILESLQDLNGEKRMIVVSR